MAREIRFRAWHKHEKVMVPLSRMTLCGEYSGILFSAPEDSKFDGICSLPGGVCDELDAYEVMQFTGLHDKNGVDIYEGDIVDHGNGISAVIWGYIGWSLSPEYEPLDIGELAERDRLKVIGNIHENPELLKDGTQG